MFPPSWLEPNGTPDVVADICTHVEGELHKILSILSSMSIAFVCRLGYPLEEPGRHLRVHRGIQKYTRRNAYLPNDEL